MNEKLQIIVADLGNIEAEVHSMVHVLDMLAEIYDLQSEMHAQCCVQVFRGWLNHLESEVAAVADELDVQSIKENGLDEQQIK